MLNKFCNTCKTPKELSDFTRDSTKRDGLATQCKQCKKEWRINNKEKIAKAKSAWHFLNKEKEQKRMKKYRDNNKEYLVEYNKKWREKNPEYSKQYEAQYIKTLKGKAIRIANSQKRRAIINQIGGGYTHKDLMDLFEKQNGTCIYCKKKLSLKERHGVNADHIMPLSKGGSNNISNIQLLCVKCNLKKGAKLPEDFAQQFGMLI